MPPSPDPTPCQPETLEVLPEVWHLALPLLCPWPRSIPPWSLLLIFSFSSLSKDCSEGAQFFLKSKKQKSLYVGVCLRNNRLLFIKAPFILFAGMCFLSSRGWDGSMEPSQSLQLLASKAAVGVAGQGRCVWRWRYHPQESLRGAPGAQPSTGQQTLAEQFFLPNSLLYAFPCTGWFSFSQNILI